jgi:hypothetical protein
VQDRHGELGHRSVSDANFPIDKWLSWIGWFTVVAGAMWLFDWALGHAPWAVTTVLGALVTFAAGWALVKLAENVRDWRRRVRREREILEAIALRQPIRLRFVREELDSMRWGAYHRRRQRFDGACQALVVFGAWTLLRVGMVFFFSDVFFRDLTPITVMWLITPPLGLGCCAIIAVTNWPHRPSMT